VLSSPYLLTISFDYLGLPTEGSVQGDLGGFFGIIETSSGNETWLAGTQEANFPGALSLIDDGQWHRATVKLDGASVRRFRLTLEDWLDSRGVAGDVFFDNIEVTDDRPLGFTIRVSEVELCFNS